ncbi:MAG TPA: hypothetical protein PK413_08515 [Thermoanaerobaculia bacterium]|nr:hypothetical protein [Thermoanaerobaculia bacterium]
MKTNLALSSLALLLLSGVLAGPAPAWSQERAFTRNFPLDDCTFTNLGRNAYFSLEPSDLLVLEGEEDGSAVELHITVLQASQRISFATAEGDRLRVRARVIEEREWVDGELAEVSRNYFARCQQTGEIYYFGEDVDLYENGRVVSHQGSWRAGANGALPGLIMPATSLVGSRYFQEVAPGVALDQAEHLDEGLTVDVPAGTFHDCIRVRETSPLDPGAESLKVYCPDVGLVMDGDALELTAFDVHDD